MHLIRAFSSLFLLFCGAAAFGAGNASSQSRPNILWITAEDMSPALGCYGDSYALTPNLDNFARESVRYTHAFASAPVCSPARSTLITGCYATSLGTHQMRSAFPIPESMRGFPALLRSAGYYTSNNVKTDYNTSSARDIIRASWNENSNTAHWRKRARKDQPFFSVFNIMTSHQSRSMVWPREQFVREVQSRLSPGEIHEPNNAPLPPYYPDTPVVRQTVARFYDCVTAMDKEAGAILKQLEEDGLANDTIVFFYADNGSGMPRHKRAVLDSGMRVPLIIRFPEKYRHLAPAPAGESINRLVNFLDFAPTVLSLAGLAIPQTMQGSAFLGSKAGSPHQHVFGHRDRVDEALDLARSVRDHRYLYIRNYMPHLSYHQPSAWPDIGEIRHEFYRLASRDKMTDPQRHYAGPTRPAEELYDCEKDPLNLQNLATSPAHGSILKKMRDAHRRHVIQARDLGFIPESEAWQRLLMPTPWQTARGNRLNLERYYEAASLVGTGSEPALIANLADEDPIVRYWGAIGLAARSEISMDARRRLQAALKDSSMAARIEAANALARHDDIDATLPVLTSALGHEDLTVLLHATRTIELLGPATARVVNAVRDVVSRMDRIRPPADVPPTVEQTPEQDLAMFISFSANAFLSKVGTASDR